MALWSTSLSLPIQLPRYASSRLGLGALYARLQPTKGPKLVAASSYQEEAAGRGEVIAATREPREVDEAVAELRAAGRRGASHSRKGRPGPPRIGGGGKHNAVAEGAPTPPGPPVEGPGGHGGSTNFASSSILSSG
ncbi:uncharacterized protein LOC133895691 [Phragmites australis]|uniref:uncharacterized protein LOC133895691 n=1 Tax=Phragmites australis TaxID=29695 RepID=UPI002D78FEE9|nr:uncharacterized protein LOC133895691 [Phragmites australis]